MPLARIPSGGCGTYGKDSARTRKRRRRPQPASGMLDQMTAGQTTVEQHRQFPQARRPAADSSTTAGHGSRVWRPRQPGGRHSPRRGQKARGQPSTGHRGRAITPTSLIGGPVVGCCDAFGASGPVGMDKTRRLSYKNEEVSDGLDGQPCELQRSVNSSPTFSASNALVKGLSGKCTRLVEQEGRTSGFHSKRRAKLDD